MMDFSFQLYSARNFPPLSAIFPKLAEFGYAQVEGFGGLYSDAGQLAADLKSAGLTMPTGHFGLDQLEDTDNALRVAETLGIETLICPAIPPEQRGQDEAGWKKLGETLAGIGEKLKAEGYGFAWHNHDFEFRPTTSGAMPLDLLLGTASNIGWEFDIAWGVRGGQDPNVWIDKYAGRIMAIHVKDIAPAGECLDEDGWADVGKGTMDWPAIMSAITGKPKAKWFVMEHDKPSDALRFASRSIAAARNFGG
jgi:sugar phosphate isomerase/epimerase